jgi:anti-anti-sigma factor
MLKKNKNYHLQKIYKKEVNHLMLIVETQKRESVYSIVVEGVLDIATVDIFHERVDQLEDEHFSSLIVDFSKLLFIDSTGIGAMLRVIYLSRDKGFLVQLDGMSENIKDIFETVGVMRILEALQKEDR